MVFFSRNRPRIDIEVNKGDLLEPRAPDTAQSKIYLRRQAVVRRGDLLVANRNANYQEFPMDFGQLSEYLNYILTWVGFGTVLGLVALVVVPGKDGGGAVATVLMAIAGAMIGCTILQSFNGGNALPISVEGFAVGASGSIVMLVFYRVLGGTWFLEQDYSLFRQQRRKRRRRLGTDLDD